MSRVIPESLSSKKPKEEKSKKAPKSKPARQRNSFRLRRRHDKVSVPKLITVRQLTKESFSLLKVNWKLFGGLALVYAISYRILVEGLSRLNFSQLQDAATNGDSSAADRAAEALISTGSALGSTADSVSQDSFTASLVTIIFTLAIVWALRQVMAGRSIKIRDALYNCMSPFISVVTVLFVIFLQSIPLSLGIFIYVAATASGVAQSGAENLAVFLLSSLLALLSCYWLSSSIIGLMAATLPGMYPLAALRAAKELVAPRRWQIFMRIVVFALLVTLAWLVIILAITLTPLTNLFIGEFVSILRAITVVLATVFLYKLYRSLVDESPVA